MSKRSATERIKQLNPKNASGTVKPALDLIQQLKKSQGNPTMPESVGAGNLASMFKFLSQVFKNDKSKEEQKKDEELIKELEELAKQEQANNSANTV